MTRVSVEERVLMAADLGRPNPLPAFRERDEDRAVKCDETVPPEDRARLGRCCGTRILPYPVWDGYDDRPAERSVRTIILENERLRATILPSLGGRLWSLVDLVDGRELLARNPVIRYANVALCNAWVAGGIEWNAGRLGHHWLTSSPVFSAIVRGARGNPAVRLWEFDRVNRAIWQVDLHLPGKSAFLFASIRLVNLNDSEIPAYWWTNMAVRESPETRVLVPADRILRHDGEGVLGLREMPAPDGFDVTRPTEHPKAWEGFFHLAEGRPFVSAFDAAGRGFCETSTRNLRGRKLFAWGMDRSGRRWQERLGADGFAYCEIQAGLARTQLETVPMPPRARWTWTEAFGPVDADPARTHGADWRTAWRHVQERLEAELPAAEVEACHARWEAMQDAPPEAIVTPGSGWGALDAIESGDAGLPGVPFPADTLGEEQAPWIDLLRTGSLPRSTTAETPAAPVTNPDWVAPVAAQGERWDALYQLGIVKLENGDPAGAREAWEASAALTPSAWALRALARLESVDGDSGAAAALLERAWKLCPRELEPALAREVVEGLHVAGRSAEAVSFAESLPPPIRNRDRIRLLEARAALAAGDVERASDLAEKITAVDLREGEAALDELKSALARAVPGQTGQGGR